MEIFRKGGKTCMGLILWLLTLSSGLAQHHCGHDHLLSQLRSLHPAEFDRLDAHARHRYVSWMQSRARSFGRSSCESYTIPVVAHIVYADSATNISDAQLHSQIRILNEDYRKINGTPGDGHGVDTRIQFCLATQDPDGKPTTGILRINSSLSAHKTIEEAQLKTLSAWDDSRYLNIWIVESVTLIDPGGQDPPRGILGYASFPTLSHGLPQGVVIDHTFVGDTGTVSAPYDRGRTLTHEVGHYLGLYHPFESEGVCEGFSENNCLSSGDRVCDTPAQLLPTYGCPDTATNSCEDRPCDRPDPAFNYMNYTDDLCMDGFTAGQAARMQFFLEGARASLVADSNLVFTGCDSVVFLTRPTADFTVSSRVTCINQTIQFEELSQGCPDSLEWFFPGGIPAQSTAAQVSVTYPLPGTFPVTLIVHNDAGSDTLTRNDLIRTSVAVQAEAWSESFESILFPPLGWQLSDTDERGSWLRTSLASGTGQFSAFIPHFDSPSCGESDILISPPLETSNRPWELQFSYAYQARNTNSWDADEFQVAVSDDCGAPWLPVFFKAGQGLATVSGTKADGPFIPGISDWEEVTIDLSPFTGSTHLRIRFSTRGKNGQNLYLDNILIRPSTSVSIDPAAEQPLVFPNPFSDQIRIRMPQWSGRSEQVVLFDLQGRQVADEIIVFDSSGEGFWTPVTRPGAFVLRMREQEVLLIRVE